MKVYTKLHATLKQQGRTQAWLARELEKSTNLIAQYCAGDTNIPLPMLYRIAELLNVNAKELLYDSVNKMQNDLDKIKSDKKIKREKPEPAALKNKNTRAKQKKHNGEIEPKQLKPS
jgi:putative transcriptional regulator